jgi:hypothetical protein
MDGIPCMHPWDILPGHSGLYFPSGTSAQAVLEERLVYDESQIVQAVNFIKHNLDITRSVVDLIDSFLHPENTGTDTQTYEGVYESEHLNK